MLPSTSTQAYDEKGGQFEQSNIHAVAAEGSFQAAGLNGQSQPPKPPKQDLYLDILKTFPKVREIPWRPGQEVERAKAEDSPRSQQRGACMLATRGKIMELKCEHCARGYGRFSLCITMDPWFQGACSTCVFTSKGKQCSLRQHASGDADGRALRYQTNLGNTPVNPSKKRKRQSAPASMKPPLNASSSTEQNFDSPESELEPNSHDLDSMLQAQIAREEDDGEPEYAMPVERLVPQARFPAHVVLPIAAQSTWASVNQPSMTDSGPMPNVSRSRDAAPITAARSITTKEPRSSGSATLSDSVGPGSHSPPLIDTLSKAKQRQIYGVIAGLESGIEQLNGQVVSLKALLGINADEPKS